MHCWERFPGRELVVLLTMADLYKRLWRNKSECAEQCLCACLSVCLSICWSKGVLLTLDDPSGESPENKYFSISRGFSRKLGKITGLAPHLRIDAPRIWNRMCTDFLSSQVTGSRSLNNQPFIFTKATFVLDKADKIWYTCLYSRFHYHKRKVVFHTEWDSRFLGWCC